MLLKRAEAAGDPIVVKSIKALVELIAKLNRELEQKTVTFLEFVIDDRLFAKDTNEVTSDQTGDQMDPPAELVAKAAAISDPKLRKLFLESAGAYIAAQRRRSIEIDK